MMLLPWLAPALRGRRRGRRPHHHHHHRPAFFLLLPLLLLLAVLCCCSTTQSSKDDGSNNSSWADNALAATISSDTPPSTSAWTPTEDPLPCSWVFVENPMPCSWAFAEDDPNVAADCFLDPSTVDDIRDWQKKYIADYLTCLPESLRPPPPSWFSRCLSWWRSWEMPTMGIPKNSTATKVAVGSSAVGATATVGLIFSYPAETAEVVGTAIDSTHDQVQRATQIVTGLLDYVPEFDLQGTMEASVLPLVASMRAKAKTQTGAAVGVAAAGAAAAGGYGIFKVRRFLSGQEDGGVACWAHVKEEYGKSDWGRGLWGAYTAASGSDACASPGTGTNNGPQQQQQQQQGEASTATGFSPRWRSIDDLKISQKLVFDEEKQKYVNWVEEEEIAEEVPVLLALPAPGRMNAALALVVWFLKLMLVLWVAMGSMLIFALGFFFGLLRRPLYLGGADDFSQALSESELLALGGLDGLRQKKRREAWHLEEALQVIGHEEGLCRAGNLVRYCRQQETLAQRQRVVYRMTQKTATRLEKEEAHVARDAFLETWEILDNIYKLERLQDITWKDREILLIDRWELFDSKLATVQVWVDKQRQQQGRGHGHGLTFATAGTAGVLYQHPEQQQQQLLYQHPEQLQQSVGALLHKRLGRSLPEELHRWLYPDRGYVWEDFGHDEKEQSALTAALTATTATPRKTKLWPETKALLALSQPFCKFYLQQYSGQDLLRHWKINAGVVTAAAALAPPTARILTHTRSFVAWRLEDEVPLWKEKKNNKTVKKDPQTLVLFGTRCRDDGSGLVGAFGSLAPFLGRHDKKRLCLAMGGKRLRETQRLEHAVADWTKADDSDSDDGEGGNVCVRDMVHMWEQKQQQQHILPFLRTATTATITSTSTTTSTTSTTATTAKKKSPAMSPAMLVFQRNSAIAMKIKRVVLPVIPPFLEHKDLKLLIRAVAPFYHDGREWNSAEKPLPVPASSLYPLRMELVLGIQGGGGGGGQGTITAAQVLKDKDKKEAQQAKKAQHKKALLALALVKKKQEDEKEAQQKQQEGLLEVSSFAFALVDAQQQQHQFEEEVDNDDDASLIFLSPLSSPPRPLLAPSSSIDAMTTMTTTMTPITTTSNTTNSKNQDNNNKENNNIHQRPQSSRSHGTIYRICSCSFFFFRYIVSYGICFILIAHVARNFYTQAAQCAMEETNHRQQQEQEQEQEQSQVVAPPRHPVQEALAKLDWGDIKITKTFTSGGDWEEEDERDAWRMRMR